MGITFSTVRGVLAQHERIIDSLKIVIEKSSEKTSCAPLIDLSFEYVSIHDFERALLYAEEAYDCASKYGDTALIVKAGRYRGQILRRKDEQSKAIEILNEVLPIAKRNHLIDEYKLILNSLALAYTYQANYDYALKLHFESMVIREEESDKEGLSVAYNNIGIVYYKMYDFERALEYYEKSLALKKETNDEFDLDILLINIGLCHIQLNDFSIAQDYINQALGLCGEKCSDDLLMIGKNGLGIAFFGLREYAKAKIYFIESLRLAETIPNGSFRAENKYYLGRIAFKEEDFNDAKSRLEESERLAEELNLTELKLGIFKELSELYIATEDFKSASLYQKRYYTLKDSVYSDRLIRNLTKVQTDYEERANIKTIAEKDQILKLREDLIKRQRAQYFFIVIITLLVIGIAGILFWANNQQRRNNQELAKAKNKIEEQNKELFKTNTELDHEVRERTKDLIMTNEALQQVNSELDNFIYKTSHDIRGPLATLKGMCNLGLIDIKDPMALDYLEKLDFTAEKLNTILTRLLIINQINRSELVPVMIDFKQIISDIVTLEEKKILPKNFKIVYDVQPGTILLSDKELIKIVLENLVDNAIKFHNNSVRVEPYVKISIEKSGGNIHIRVSDNGIGINQTKNQNIFQMFVRASERSETGGIGLYLTKLSTEKLGGTITLEDTSEHGSTFLVELPNDLNMVLAKRRHDEEKRKIEKEKIAELKEHLHMVEGKS